MPTVTDRTVITWQDKVTTAVKTAGQGAPLVFLHGETGLQWDPFLDTLAQTHTVYAPLHPGTDGQHPDAIRAVDTLHDLVVYYAGLLDDLGVAAAPIVGHSFGGMVAAELAAACPERVSRLVLINPLGLWRDDIPVTNWMALPPQAVVQATFADAEGPLATMITSMMENLGSQPEMAANYVWALGCTGKFVWPIPDRGLHKRIHRIHAPTLIVWGRHDGIVPVAYADEFATRILGARVEILEDAGHVPHLEQPERVAALVDGFLTG